MKKLKNILTVYASKRGTIKDVVIQKQGKMKAHLVVAPELIKSTVTEHPFTDDLDRKKFSKICEEFTLKEKGKQGTIIKKRN